MRFRNTLAVAFAFVFALALVGSASAESRAALISGKVVTVDAAQGTFTLDTTAGKRIFWVNEKSQIVGAAGSALKLSSLNPGDMLRIQSDILGRNTYVVRAEVGDWSSTTTDTTTYSTTTADNTLYDTPVNDHKTHHTTTVTPPAPVTTTADNTYDRSTSTTTTGNDDYEAPVDSTPTKRALPATAGNANESALAGVALLGAALSLHLLRK